MDPWDWSVDEVVRNLCHRRDLWADRLQSSLPDKQPLELSLRENEIDGSTLLQSVDLQTIKDDLGVRPLGQRSAVHHAIKKLQAQSPKYINQQNSLSSPYHVETARNPIHTLSPAQTPPHFGGRFNPALQPEHGESPSIKHQLFGPQHDQVQDEQHQTASPSTEPQKEAHARRGEVLVENKDGGRKRRKLILEAGSPKPRMGLVDGKPKEVESAKSYLGKSTLALDDMFYGNVAYGKPVSDSKEDHDDDPTFLGCSPLPHGKQKIIDRSIKYLFRAEPKRIDAARFAFYPYPSHVVAPQAPRSLTLFQADGNRSPTGKKWMESMIDYKTLPDDHPQDNDNAGHEWDYLLSKYVPNEREDDILPVYNDSGSEGEYAGSLLDEIDEAEEQKIRENEQQQHLTPEQVFNVIDQAIEGYQRQWRDEKLPAKAAKAYGVWRKGSGRKRQAALEQAHRQLEWLEMRTLKYKKEIASEVWKKPQQVEKQCAILETTIFDKEETSWKVQLWKKDLPPPRNLAPTPPKVPKPTVHDNIDEEGESLTSDVDDVDDVDDFVEVDDSGPAKSPPSSKENVESWLEDQVASASTTKDQPQTPTDREPSPDSVLGPSPAAGEAGRVTVDLGDNDDRMDLDEEPVLPKTSMSRIPKDAPVIDLTMSSSPIIPASPLPFSATQELLHLSNKPELESLEEISAWTYEELEENDDRKRLMLKLLSDMESTLCDRMKNWLANVDARAFMNYLQRGLDVIRHDLSGIPGVKEREQQTIFSFCRLFICWNACNHVFMDKQVLVKEKTWKGTLTDIESNLTPFHTFLKQVMGPNGPFVTGDSEVEDVDSPRKRKKFKRRNQEARKMVHNAQTRRDQVIQAEKKLEQSGALAEGKLGVIINPGKDDDQDFIHINNQVSDRMKLHQIAGVRFLWREAVSTSSMQGGLLAHTMGLGKSMQTITFLVTLAEAAKSSNPRIHKQVPEELRQQRTLILCPAGLIENWQEEFRLWRPQGDNIGHIYEVTSALDRVQRLATISAWHNDGGVLIIGYDLFRDFLTNGGSKKNRNLYEDDILLLTEQLLNGPNVVVADEAHKMKNMSTGIGRLTPMFRTQTRIALTGSPLANNLTEYYAMIEWVAPGYLGDIAEFRAVYEKPIQDGNFLDSTNYEKRRALKKMEALKADIDPKVSRADITVLSDTLPPKTEFLIRIAMSDWQLEAYRSFVRYLRHGENVEIVSLWKWMNLLLLLLHHPAMLLEKLEERQKIDSRKKKGRKPKKSEAIDVEDEGEEGTVDVPESMLEQQRQISASLEHLQSIEHSYKSMIIEKIVAEAVSVGDSVLIFSNSLKTLTWLGRCLEASSTRLRIVRMDGSTAFSDRMALSKGFNDGLYDVFLISTKAGGLGINIPGANRVILADFGWNPTLEEQAIGRAYRIGQKKPVFVYQLVTAGTFQDVLYQRAVFKRQLAIRAVDKKNVTAVANKPEDFLFEPREEQQDDLSGYKGKDHVLDSLLDSPLGETVLTMATEELLRTEIKDKLTDEELQEVRQMQEDNKLRLTNHAEWRRREDARQIEEQRKAYIEQRRENEESRRACADLKIPLKPPGYLNAQPQQVQSPMAQMQPPTAQIVPSSERMELGKLDVPSEPASPGLGNAMREKSKALNPQGPSPEPEDMRTPKKKVNAGAEAGQKSGEAEKSP